MKIRNLVLLVLLVFVIVGCGDDSPKKYTVTFNANGGIPEPQTQTIEQGGKVAEPDTMTKSNCSFDAWYKENGFSNKWNFANDTVSANITLYAKWDNDPVCECPEGTTHEPNEECCNGTGCTCSVEQAEFKSAKINPFEEYIVTVEGTMLASEWEGVPDKVEEIINSAFNSGNNASKNRFRGTLGNDGVIIVEKTEEYAKYKVIGNSEEGNFDAVNTLYLNVYNLDNLTDENIRDAVLAMFGGQNAMVKAIPAKSKNTLETYLASLRSLPEVVVKNPLGTYMTERAWNQNKFHTFRNIYLFNA